jgi:PKHD-type hydroxylase
MPIFYDTVQTAASLPGIFTKQECEEIIRIGESKQLEVGTFANGRDHKDTRDSKISWLAPEDGQWIYERVIGITNEANQKLFGFNIYGFNERFQFTKYEAPSGNYSKHVDSRPGSPVRKISLTIQLSDPTTYEGGELILHAGNDPYIVPKEQGLVAVFPSYILHEVRPITTGTRYSLVAWVTGEPFR